MIDIVQESGAPAEVPKFEQLVKQAENLKQHIISYFSQLSDFFQDIKLYHQVQSQCSALRDHECQQLSKIMQTLFYDIIKHEHEKAMHTFQTMSYTLSKRSKILLLSFETSLKLLQLDANSQSEKFDFNLQDYVGEKHSIKDYFDQTDQQLRDIILENNLKQYRPIREDGDSFFTSLGFGLLETLEFTQFELLLKTIRMNKIFSEAEGEYIQFDAEEENEMKKMMVDLIKSHKMCDKEDIQKLFQKSFNREFYLTFQIFIRSLCYDILRDYLKQNPNHKAQVGQSSINELFNIGSDNFRMFNPILQTMSNKFKIHIRIYGDELLVFGDFKTKCINLLHLDGHYELAY